MEVMALMVVMAVKMVPIVMETTTAKQMGKDHKMATIVVVVAVMDQVVMVMVEIAQVVALMVPILIRILIQETILVKTKMISRNPKPIPLKRSVVA